MPRLAAGEKSRRSRCGKAIEAFGRPSGLISHSRLRWTRAMNELTEITLASSISTAQGRNLMGRAHAGKRASTATTAHHCHASKRLRGLSHGMEGYPRGDIPSNTKSKVTQLRSARHESRPHWRESATRPSPNAARHGLSPRDRARLDRGLSEVPLSLSAARRKGARPQF